MTRNEHTRGLDTNLVYERIIRIVELLWLSSYYEEITIKKNGLIHAMEPRVRPEDLNYDPGRTAQCRVWGPGPSFREKEYHMWYSIQVISHPCDTSSMWYPYDTSCNVTSKWYIIHVVLHPHDDSFMWYFIHVISHSSDTSFIWCCYKRTKITSI